MKMKLAARKSAAKNSTAKKSTSLAKAKPDGLGSLIAEVDFLAVEFLAADFLAASFIFIG